MSIEPLGRMLVVGSLGVLALCADASEQCNYDVRFDIAHAKLHPDSGSTGESSFEANGTSGCDDPYCCSVVCAQVPVCCVNAWETGCASVAASTCPGDAYHVVTGINSNDTMRLDGFAVGREAMEQAEKLREQYQEATALIGEEPPSRRWSERRKVYWEPHGIVRERAEVVIGRGIVACASLTRVSFR